MIVSLKIENFKSFRSLEINNITQVNLIGGLNNVGKTTLLEAIFNFYDQLSPEIFVRQFSWRGVISLSFKKQNLYELWSPVFYNYDTKKEIKIYIEDQNSENQELFVKIEKESLFSLPKNNLKVIPDISNGGTDSGLQYILHIIGKKNSSLVLDTFIRFGEKGFEINRKKNKVLNLPQAHFFNSRTLNAKEDAIRFGELIKEGKEELVIKALQEFEPKIKTINPVPLPDNITILFADIGLLKKVPLNYLGDGITRLLSYILAIITSKNGIVLIDEIENGFHYTKHKMVWAMLFKLAKEFNVQLFANTHSYEMSKAYNEVTLEKGLQYSYFELFTNPKSKDVMINQLDPETLKLKIKSNKPFRGE